MAVAGHAQRSALTNARYDRSSPFHPDGTMRAGAGRWTVVAVMAGARAPAIRAKWEAD